MISRPSESQQLHVMASLPPSQASRIGLACQKRGFLGKPTATSESMAKLHNLFPRLGQKTDAPVRNIIKSQNQNLSVRNKETARLFLFTLCSDTPKSNVVDHTSESLQRKAKEEPKSSKLFL